MTGVPPELASAVAASPDDPTPRLACADWLDEHGDPDAATFVRSQVRLSQKQTLRLSPKEVSRLRDQCKSLEKAHRSRWVLEPLGAAKARGIAPEWQGGFVVGLRVSTACRVPVPELLPRLGAFPLLNHFLANTHASTPLNAALAALPDLPCLGTLALNADGETPDGAALAAIAARPRLRHVATSVHGGDFWRGRSLTPDELIRVLELRAQLLREVPTADLLDRLRPFAREIHRTRDGRAFVRLEDDAAVSAIDGETLARVPGLAVLSLWTPEVPAWLADVPGLLGLTLYGLTRFDAGPLVGLTDLRSVGVFAANGATLDGASLLAWLASRPRVGCLATNVPLPVPVPAGVCVLRVSHPTALPSPGPVEVSGRIAGEIPPGLRGVSLSGSGTREEWDAEAQALQDRGVFVQGHTRAFSIPLGEPETVAGVTLRLPDWFRRVETPPDASRDGVEALATWAEWGDGSPEDRVPEPGPAWVRLERLPYRVLVADAGEALRGPPGELADVRAWGGVSRQSGEFPFSHLTGRCAFATHFRALWCGRHAALRLRVERPRGRVLFLEQVTDAVARSVCVDWPTVRE